MTRTRRRLLLGTLIATASAMAGCAGWRLSAAARLARRSVPFESAPDHATRRLLVVGDSTAVGTGATSPLLSVAGRIARAHPQWTITNRAADGARIADVVRQLQSARGGNDLVLVMAGGNDVIRFTDFENWRAGLRTALRLARERGHQVTVMPCGNVGHAPFFWPPLSWWMSARSHRLHEITAEVAREEGARYVKLLMPKDEDPFAQAPSLMHAADGLHPSDEGYRSWFEAPVAQGGLVGALSNGRAP